MKKIFTKRVVYAFITAVCMVFLYVVAFQKLNNREIYQNAAFLDKGWTVSWEGNTYKDIDLSIFSFESMKKGNIVEMWHVIPENNLQIPSIRLWICLSAYDLYVGDELIFSYGKERMEQGKMVGSDYHYIVLPKDCSGKTLHLVVYVNEKDAFTYLEVPVIEELEDQPLDYLSENFLSVCAGIFLLVFGICIIVTSIFLSLRLEGFSQVIYTGFFSFLIGMWMLCNRGFASYISEDHALNLMCEYFSLYICPIPILLYIYNMRKEDKNKWLSRPLLMLCAINVIMVLVTIFLHVTNISHFSTGLYFYHIFDMISLIYICITGTYCLTRYRSGSDKLLAVGVIFMVLTCATDLISFNIGKYRNAFFNQFVGASAWGALAFIICMLFSFGVRVLQGITTKAEQETLRRLAYVDQLTQIPNRTRYDEKLHQILKDQLPYTMVNFDVNNLKECNDTMGHAYGDQLLCAFANVLTDVFSEHGVVCRTGGDEFNVLLPGCDREKVEELMLEYERRMDLENTKGHPFRISAAWGEAYSDEEPNLTSTMVFQMADKRMYSRKRKMRIRQNA